MRFRLTISIVGTFYTAISLFLFAMVVPLSSQLFWAAISTAGATFILAALMLPFTFSSLPNKWLGLLMEKLKILQQFEGTELPKKIFFTAFWQIFLSLILSLLGLIVLLCLVDIRPTFQIVITIAAMIALGNTLFFVVPQSIGVRELGFSGAFYLLGYSPSVGLSIALLRRLNGLIWLFFFLGIHLLLVLKNKICT